MARGWMGLDGAAAMRVSTAEFISRVGDLADRAETEPVTITEGGRDRLVLVSAGEYARLVDHDGAASRAGVGGRGEPIETVEPRGEMPELWGALKHTIVYVSDDVAEPIGEAWDAER